MLTGCNCPPPPGHYTGPTETMAKVVAAINANNSKVPTLWAHHYYEADVVDDKHQSHHANGDGVLLYLSPISMRLRANAAVVGMVFEIGSNPEKFWLKLGKDTGDAMWWGKYADLANIDPESPGIPMRPDMILDVLGIATINTDFNALPAPTMRFNNTIDKINSIDLNQGSYVFIWNGRMHDRWVALREVWYDRVTKRPTLVLLYDTNGRVVLRAELSHFRQLSIAGTPKEQWPWIPGHYQLIFPESGSFMKFTLDEAMLKNEVDDDGEKLLIPQPRNFVMPGEEGIKNVLEVTRPPSP